MITAPDINLCAKSSNFICEEDATRNMVRISKSSRDTFVTCRQSYYFRYLCGIKVKPQYKSDALKLGSVWDEFVQYAYEGKSFRDRFIELAELYQLELIDIARIEPLFKVYYMLGLNQQINGELQDKFEFVSGKAVINGVLDVKYSDHFEEVKLSGSPDWYLNPFNVANQLATYFLSDDKLEHCELKVTRRPGQRLKKGEEPEELAQRILSEVLSKPSHYFMGYNRAENTYGVNYYRDEFAPLDSVIEDYGMVTADLLDTLESGRWYQNKNACYKFGPDNACEYLDLCTIGSGKVDEEKYDIGGR